MRIDLHLVGLLSRLLLPRLLFLANLPALVPPAEGLEALLLLPPNQFFLPYPVFHVAIEGEFLDLAQVVILQPD